MVEINLLPWRKENDIKKAQCFKRQMLVMFVIVVSFLVIWHIVLKRQINVVTRQTIYMQKQLFLFEPLLRGAEEIRKQQIMLQQTIHKITRLETQRINLVKFFSNLHHDTVSGFYATHLLIKDGSATLFGRARSTYGVAHLVKSLTKMNYYSTPVVQKISKQNNEYEFILFFPH